MQRRAAAIYFAFFLVVGVAAYASIGVAQENSQPQFDLDGVTLGDGESTTIDGTEYTVAELGHEESGDDHGGGGGGDLVATLEWTNESAVQSATLDNESTQTIDETEYTVVIAGGENVSSFTLREELNVSEILQNDDAVENSLAERDGTQYVVYRENDSIREASEYLPEPETREFEVGDTYPYEGNETTVAEVEPDAVTVEWTGPESRSEELEEGNNVTLANGEQYFAHFPNDEAVLLVPGDQYANYAATLEERDSFNERVNGLWGVVIISSLAAFIIVSAAYMPTRG